MSLILFPYDTNSMLHVDFKKSPCHPVKLRGQGPYTWIKGKGERGGGLQGFGTVGVSIAQVFSELIKLFLKGSDTGSLTSVLEWHVDFP